MTDLLIRRLTEPPFGTETSERNLMAEAARALLDARAIINGKTFTVDEAQELVAQARADTEAAVALALEEADLAVQAVSDNCETDGERLAIMAAVSAIRALAPASGVAKLEALRAELDEWRAVSETLSEMSGNAEAERDRLAAELDAANAREAGLADLLGRGAMYVSLSMREWHNAVAAALAQPSTEGVG